MIPIKKKIRLPQRITIMSDFLNSLRAGWPEPLKFPVILAYPGTGWKFLDLGTYFAALGI